MTNDLPEIKARADYDAWAQNRLNDQLPANTTGNITPLTMLDKAVTSGQSVEALEKLMDLQERWEKREAEKAFYIAISDFQANCPTIVKRKEMRTGSATSYYAPLGDIAEQIRDTLRQAELSFRFKIADDEAGTRVTCIISHALGHSEETTMVGGADTSGSKNAIQSVGSTVTYLQRYTLIGALGLTTADEDMDGRIQQDYITADQRKDLESRAKAADVDMVKYLKYLGIDSLGELRAVDYAKAEQAMKDKEKRVAAE